MKYKIRFFSSFGDEKQVKEVLNKLINQFKITDIFTNQIFRNKYTLDLDQKCSELFVEKGVNWHQLQQFGIQLENRKRNYWANQWNKFIDNGPQTIKASCKFLTVEAPISEVKTNQIDGSNIQKGGRKTGLKILDTFLNLRSKSYLKNISSPKYSSKYCSRISPYLTWGAISSKEVFKKVKYAKELITKEDKYWKKNLTSFQSRLSWRCHFIQKLEDDPTIEYLCMHKSFENLRMNSYKEEFFNAWKLGQTGYPFVDACMRNLINQGWITFRMRAMLVSFASYDLWLDWRDFAHHLAKLFTDYEPGIHYSQLQMQSGVTGINTYRIYNPIKQSKEHDENGDFIKKWVPELQNLNSNWVHEPWKMDFDTQKKFRCIIGKDYPHPIVDHKEAVSLAKSKIAEIRKGVNFKTIAKKVYTKHGSRNSNRDNNFVDSKLKKIKTNKQLSLSF